MTGPTEKQPSWFSESLARGLSVIRVFSADTPLLRPADVSKRSGLNRAVARRYMLTLKALGYLGSDGERFFLQPKVLDLGYAFLSSMQIDRLVQPFLNELSSKTGESSSYAVLDREEVLFVARAPSASILQIAIGVGGHVPAYSTSLGHVLLSGLPGAQLDRYLKSLRTGRPAGPGINASNIKKSVEKTKKQGWCLVTNLLTDGIEAIAAPVRKRNGEILGALNIATYGSANAKVIKEHLPLLIETATNLSRALQSIERANIIEQPQKAISRKR